MKFKNYIWDFDGTIADSYPHSCAVFMRVLEEEGMLGSLDGETIMRHMRVGFGDVCRFTGMSDEAYRRFCDRNLTVGEGEELPLAVPYPFARELLSAVVENGGRNYLYTHRDRRTTTFYLEKFGFAEFLSDVMDADDGYPSKPDPSAILALIERNSLVPDECIMIGDREIDGMSGKNAGIVGALVNYPPLLPDGCDPVAVSMLDYKAETLSEFAQMMGII